VDSSIQSRFGVKQSGSDPYGANKPSPLPSPTDPQGEPIPSPGLPDKYPDYLKPIPINTRDIEEVMRGYLNSKEPELKKILYSTWNADREALKFQEIRNAIRDGEFSEQVVDRWRQSYAKMVDQELRPQWEDAIEASANHMGDQVKSKLGVKPRFDKQSKRILDWMDQRGAELVVDITRHQRRALRASIKYYTVENPVGAEELGRLLRAQVGLTPKQTQAVNNFRQALVESDEELAQDTIEHRVQNYVGRLERIRAERIARTELSFAYNKGTLEQMRQVNNNELADETIVKRLHVAQDERTCNFCEPLHNTIVGFKETFPGATERLPNVNTPPLHPNCRCAVIYEVLER
jgi:SPP1 gp7 family putative phage head morphogenesis protein